MTNPNYKRANKRFLRFYFPVIILYVGIFIAGLYILAMSQNPSVFLRAVLAMLTAAPIVAVVWLMGRYLNETDEYTRKVQTNTMLIGGGITLSAVVFWSFLELYQVTPKLDHVPSLIMVGPLFFGAWGITYLIHTIKEK